MRNMNIEASTGHTTPGAGEGADPERKTAATSAAEATIATRATQGIGRRAMAIRPRPSATTAAEAAVPKTSQRPIRDARRNTGFFQANGVA